MGKCNELLVVVCSNDNAFHFQEVFCPRILKYFKLIKGNLKSVQFSVILLMQAPVPPLLKPSLVAHWSFPQILLVRSQWRTILTTSLYTLLGNFRLLLVPAATLAGDQSKEANGSEWEMGSPLYLGKW